MHDCKDRARFVCVTKQSFFSQGDFCGSLEAWKCMEKNWKEKVTDMGERRKTLEAS